MKKNDLTLVKTLIEQVNPLKLMSEDTVSRVFTSKRECYVETMKLIHSNSANGYHDIEWIISRLYHLRRACTIHSVYMCFFKPLGIKPRDVISDNDRERKEFYRKFIKAMHSYCETEFDTYQFDMAYLEFKTYLEGKPVIKSTKELQDEKDRVTKSE